MCEQFAARADEPFELGEPWELAARLERFGIAGFGWGAAWLEAGGRLVLHRDPRSLRDDSATEDLSGVMTTSALVHLRRPSRRSTLTLADTQPFADPAGRYAFSHHGDFRRHRDWRARYRAQGRLHGRTDTEVGARWLEDEWRPAEPPGRQLAALHETFQGPANLALLLPDGSVHHYAGNPENPVFGFRLGSIRVLSTGIHSLDSIMSALCSAFVRFGP